MPATGWRPIGTPAPSFLSRTEYFGVGCRSGAPWLLVVAVVAVMVLLVSRVLVGALVGCVTREGEGGSLWVRPQFASGSTTGNSTHVVARLMFSSTAGQSCSCSSATWMMRACLRAVAMRRRSLRVRCAPHGHAPVCAAMMRRRFPSIVVFTGVSFFCCADSLPWLSRERGVVALSRDTGCPMCGAHRGSPVGVDTRHAPPPPLTCTNGVVRTLARHWNRATG